jgi:hypothetical protein
MVAVKEEEGEEEAEEGGEGEEAVKGLHRDRAVAIGTCRACWQRAMAMARA